LLSQHPKRIRANKTTEHPVAFPEVVLHLLIDSVKMKKVLFRLHPDSEINQIIPNGREGMGFLG
jgi:hypothetical protein